MPVLCPPWCYGYGVHPSPSFFESGLQLPPYELMADQFHEPYVKEPTWADVMEMTNYPMQAALETQDLNGGWDPGRSIVVNWGGLECFYKAGDGGDFDMWLADDHLTHEMVHDLLDSKAKMHELWTMYEARVMQTVRDFNVENNFQYPELRQHYRSLVVQHLEWSARTMHTTVCSFGAR